MKVRKGDKVKVIAGKDKGVESEVAKVLIGRDMIVVENVNVVKKHTKAKGKIPGGIVEISKPISVSNVMIVCPKCKKTTRIGYLVEGDKKFRVCKKCKQKI